MTKDFLILGGESTLAKYFTQTYKERCVSLNKSKCDITDIKILEKVIQKSDAHYIINCAAITDIGYAEKNPEECFNVNSISVRNLDTLSRKYNKKLIHLSSDYAVNPTNVYGYSKLISEKLIDKSKNLVIRTSFYSNKYYIIKSLVSGNVTNAYKNAFFNPVSINRLIEEIYKNRDKKGILNIFTERKISKYKFAIKVAKTFDVDRKLIQPSNFVNEKGKANLPPNSFVDSDIKIPLEEDLLSFKKHFVPFRS
ncbi:MAG: sugar nucleotide-binding protein [Candidatus Woesebacteria bacterium]|nr:MAG: sugar nucleotide-binding protein [Candidatus Woesebacteria bacterium]